MNMHPELSVVLTIGSLRDLSEKVLQALLEQDVIDRMEILVVDSVSPDIPPLHGSAHRCVRVIRLPEDALFETAMVMGIREARAPIVALLEEHCIVLPGWAHALIEAHKEPWGAVCGAVINGNPGLGVSNAEFLATRNIRWQSPAQRVQLPMIDGHNSAYKRDILLGYGDQLEQMLKAVAVLLFKIQEDGYQLLLEPAAKYIHVNEAFFRTVPTTLLYWHRVFGHTRALIFHWSPLQRMLRLLMLPLLPFWHCLSTFVFILGKRPDRIWAFIWNLPLMLFFHYCAVIGQAMGILFGEGDIGAKSSERERGVERIPMTELIK